MNPIKKQLSDSIRIYPYEWDDICAIVRDNVFTVITEKVFEQVVRHMYGELHE